MNGQYSDWFGLNISYFPFVANASHHFIVIEVTPKSGIGFYCTLPYSTSSLNRWAKDMFGN